MVEDKRKLFIPYMYLNISDLAMGVYMLMIAITDFLYQGEYAIIHSWWRQSWQCWLLGYVLDGSFECCNSLCNNDKIFTVLHYKYKLYKNINTLFTGIHCQCCSYLWRFLLERLLSCRQPVLCAFFMSNSDTPLYIIGQIWMYQLCSPYIP